jgi:hypothetical protein
MKKDYASCIALFISLRCDFVFLSF